MEGVLHTTVPGAPAAERRDWSAMTVHSMGRELFIVDHLPLRRHAQRQHGTRLDLVGRANPRWWKAGQAMSPACGRGECSVGVVEPAVTRFHAVT